jgi:transcriptional regulator with GAF, ATPase, and Fis domain
VIEIDKGRAVINDSVVQEWQTIVDTIADICNVPAALVMRVTDSDIAVFSTSNSEGNPYHVGDKECLAGSGLYCEMVIKTQKKLLVPNALKDPVWDHNPDIKLNMISYLGYPLTWPDGEPFGTICMLDKQENAYSEKYEKLLEQMRNIIQMHLDILNLNLSLGYENRQLKDHLEEIQQLREIIPVCSHCKKVRDNEGFWQQVDTYLKQFATTGVSHGICPDCLSKYYDEV